MNIQLDGFADFFQHRVLDKPGGLGRDQLQSALLPHRLSVSRPGLGMRSTFLIRKEITDVAAAYKAALRPWVAIALERETKATPMPNPSVSTRILR